MTTRLPPAGDRIGREQHPGGVGVDHALDHDGERHAVVDVAVVGPVRHRSLIPERGPTSADGIQQRLRSLDVEERVLLPGEARAREVLRGRR